MPRHPWDIKCEAECLFRSHSAAAASQVGKAKLAADISRPAASLTWIEVSLISLVIAQPASHWAASGVLELPLRVSKPSDRQTERLSQAGSRRHSRTSVARQLHGLIGGQSYRRVGRGPHWSIASTRHHPKRTQLIAASSFLCEGLAPLGLRLRLGLFACHNTASAHSTFFSVRLLYENMR